MAISWMSSLSNLDADVVFAPERYSSKRLVQTSEWLESVPLVDIASLNRTTINIPQTNAPFVVLDTTHAVEGKVLYSGPLTKGSDIGSVKRPVRSGNVIVSRLRTYLRQVALIDDHLLRRFGVDAMCSTEFYVLESTDGRDIAFLVPYLLSEQVQEIFRHSQEGGHHPRMHQSVLMDLRVPQSLIEKRDHLSTMVRRFITAIREGEDVFSECADQVANLIRPKQ